MGSSRNKKREIDDDDIILLGLLTWFFTTTWLTIYCTISLYQLKKAGKKKRRR